MDKKKIITVVLMLFLILSCSAQKKPSKLIKETNHGQFSLNNEIVFSKNSLQLDSIRKGKKVLDYLGKAIIGGGSDLREKYSVFLGVSSNEAEISKNKFIDSNRVIFILNYLKKNYDIDSDMFVIHFHSTSTNPSSIFFSLIDKLK